MDRANELFGASKVPITPRLGGNFALDLAAEGVSKTTSIHKVLTSNDVLSAIELTTFKQEDPSELPRGFNLVLWDGKHHLHHGLLEYLSSRH